MKMFLLLLFLLFAICFAIPPIGETSKSKDFLEEIKEQRFLMGQIEVAKKLAVAYGLCFVSSDRFAPFSLLPSPFPRALFHQAVDVQKWIQLLHFRAMRDFDFLKEMHQSIVKSNADFRQTVEFIENLYKDGFKQPLILFCQRSDYMANENDENNVKKLELKQVEVNTGPIGGIGNSSRVTMLHRQMLSMEGAEAPATMVPPNHSDTMVAQALYRAWQEFGNGNAVILFLHCTHSDSDVLSIESRHVQYEVERISNAQTKCVFLTLREAMERLKLDPNNFSLILDDKFLVAVANHRYSAFTLNELKFTREVVRRSTAIQDSYRSLLAHTKRMQQIYTMPGVVERFFPRPDEAHIVKAIRQVLTKSWSIGEEDEEAEQIIKEAKTNPEKYVMKWNECGQSWKGKDIFFDNEISKKLGKMTSTERNSFIIIEKLHPMVVKNHFVFPHSPPLLNVEATPELGIFGCLLANIEEGTVLQHYTGEAHQMKTKLASEKEGGIWQGKSVFDSPLLV